MDFDTPGSYFFLYQYTTYQNNWTFGEAGGVRGFGGDRDWETGGSGGSTVDCVCCGESGGSGGFKGDCVLDGEWSGVVL